MFVFIENGNRWTEFSEGTVGIYLTVGETKFPTALQLVVSSKWQFKLLSPRGVGNANWNVLKMISDSDNSFDSSDTFELIEVMFSIGLWGMRTGIGYVWMFIELLRSPGSIFLCGSSCWSVIWDENHMLQLYNGVSMKIEAKRYQSMSYSSCEVPKLRFQYASIIHSCRQYLKTMNGEWLMELMVILYVTF